MVCFVDNDPVYWDLVAGFFRRSHIEYGPCVKHDFAAIDDMIEDYSPHVVIVCFKSTQPDTLDSIRWLNNRYPNIQIIISTLYNYPSTIKLCESVWYHSFFIKSTGNCNTLLEKINEALELNKVSSPQKLRDE